MFKNFCTTTAGKRLFEGLDKIKQTTTEDTFLHPEPHLPSNYKFNAEETEALSLAHASLLFEYNYGLWLSFGDIFKACDSTIERIFLGALIAQASTHTLTPRIIYPYPAAHGGGRAVLDADASTFQICLQEQIGDYRVDFLLQFIDTERVDNNPDPKTGRYPCKEVYHNLVIECDGHDFHEKTKAQASKDKERDRILQKCGYPVFRYSGSVIYKDPTRCANECLDYLWKVAGDKDAMD